MATAPQPVSPANSGGHRTVITVAVIVAIIGLIIFSAIWVRRHSPIRRLDELRLQAELQRSGLRRRRRQQEQREKGIGISLLQSIPIVKYDGGPSKIRRTKSLDLEKGHQNRGAHNWSLEQSQHNIKEMHAEMTEIDKSPHKKEKDGNQKKSDLEPEEPECPICTQPFVKNDFLRVLPCGHRHHQRCVDRWLLGFGGTCPVCRVHMDSFYLQSPEPPLDLPMKPEPVVVTGEDLEDSHHHRPDL